MAKQVEIGVKIDVDKAKKEMVEIEKRVRELNQSEKDNEELTRMLDKRYTELATNIEKASKSSGNLVTKMASLPGPVGSAAKGFQGLVTAAKSFIATPVGAVITAVVGALTLMKTALSSTEEGQQKLAKVTGTLKGVLNGLKEVLVQVAPLIADVFTANWTKIGEDWEKVKDAFGNIGNVAKQTGEIAEARKKLEKETALWSKREAELNGEMLKYQGIAKNISKTEKERTDANQKAFDISQQIIQGQIDLKQKEIKLMKQEQALTSNTQEDNIDLINLEKELIDLQNEKKRALNEFNQTQNRIDKKAKSDANAEKAELEKEEKQRKEEFEKQKKHNQDLINLQKIKVDQLKKGSEEWLVAQQELIKLTYDADVFAAQEDETLLAIADEKKKQAETVAKETADAYKNALVTTLENLNKLFSPELTGWDKVKADLENDLKEIEDAINKAYSDEMISAEEYSNFMTKLAEKRKNEEIKLEEKISDAKREQNYYVAENYLSMLNDITSASADKSEEMFNINKGLQIAQASIEGARAAIKVFADDTAPYAVKVAEAAAIAGSTVATIARISQTTFDKSGNTNATSYSTGLQSTVSGRASLEQGVSSVNETLVGKKILGQNTGSVQTVLVLEDLEYRQRVANRVVVESKI